MRAKYLLTLLLTDNEDVRARPDAARIAESGCQSEVRNYLLPHLRGCAKSLATAD